MKDVFWIERTPKLPAPSLAIVLRPRGDDWLPDELSRMKHEGVRTIVSMLESEEAGWLGLSEEATTAADLGLEFLSYPIPDRQVPADVAGFSAFIRILAERVGRNQSVGVHCRGSIGRSTLTVAATLIHLGWKASDALASIEKARGCPVPDTDEQRKWILAYEVEK